MSEEKEAFLDRWSRLKRQEAEAPAVPAEQEVEANDEPAVALPPIEELGPDSDFKPFMDPKVDLGTRRAALKKLFADAHYNEPDLFEPYSADFTVGEPIPAEMLKTLNHARKLLFDEPENAAEAAAAQAGPEPDAAQPETPAEELKNAVGKQDA
jgi:hypothetical protein